MSKPDYPVTTAIRFLREKKIDFEPFLFEYEEKGGTAHTSRELKISENLIVKTLVFENESGELFIVLMHGDKEVSTKELARFINVKKITPASEEKANKITGYQFGGTSPFGTRTKMKIYVESSIFVLDEIYINGGKRGFIIKIKSVDLRLVFPNLIEINAAI